MDLFNQLSSWADSKMINGFVFYSIGYQKIVDELPLFFSKKDTAYRSFLRLRKEGFIEQKKVGNNQLNYIRLTEKGKQWNGYLRVGNKSEPKAGSEINPSRVGNKSEPEKNDNYYDNQLISVSGSEINPTDNIDNILQRDNTTRARVREEVLNLGKLVGSFFGKTTEEQLLKVTYFLNTQVKKERFDVFKLQFEAYKKYKAASGEKIHRFESFCTEWDQQDWALLLKNYQHQQQTVKEPEVKPLYLRDVS